MKKCVIRKHFSRVSQCFFFSFLPKVVFSCSLFSIFSLCILGVWCCSFYFNIFSASLVLRCSMPRKLIVCWGEFLVWFPFLNGNSFACQSGAHRNTHTSTQHIYVSYLHSFIIIYEYFMNFKHSTHLFKEIHRKMVPFVFPMQTVLFQNVLRVVMVNILHSHCAMAVFRQTAANVVWGLS